MKLPTKEFTFSIDLGAGLKPVNSSIAIFGIKKGLPKLLDTRDIKRQKFKIKLPITDFKYFYIVTKIETYQFNRKDGNTKKNNVQLLSTFDSGSFRVSISEQSTVANTFSFSRFMKVRSDGKVIISGTEQLLTICYKMKNNFVHTNGKVSSVIKSAPNGLETNSYALFNFLSNLVYYCILDADVCRDFLSLSFHTKKSAGSVLMGLLNLVYHPFTNVKKIYSLISESKQVYKPSLPMLKVPKQVNILNQWTLAIKVNDSGAENFLIGGPGYLAFDKNDRAWITNNVRQGSSNSSTFCVILNSDGSPCHFSPLFGGGLLGGGFGVTTDLSKEHIYLGNFGWGPTEYNPQKGSISVFSHEGKVLSPSNGYTNKLSRVQGMAFDSKGNLWMCSWGSQDPLIPASDAIYDFDGANSAVVVYLKGNPQNAIIYEFLNQHFKTFDIVIDKDDNAIISNGGSPPSKGNLKSQAKSSVYKLKIVKARNGDEKIIKVKRWESNLKNPYESFRQVSLNPKGEIFIAAVNSSRIIKLDKDLKFVKDFTKNIYNPWGVTFDSMGTMFVSNFLLGYKKDHQGEDPLAVEMPFGITIIRNENEKTSKLMTLPTGGKEVTLANGEPVYGTQLTKSFVPLTRLTASVIDRAGNLWAINNFKPSIYIDLVAATNPGGDGIVIFVGVAKPPKTP